MASKEKIRTPEHQMFLGRGTLIIPLLPEEGKGEVGV